MNSNTAGSPSQQPISASDAANKSIDEIMSSVEESYRRFMVSFNMYQNITSMLNTLRGNPVDVTSVSANVDTMIASDGNPHDDVIEITLNDDDE